MGSWHREAKTYGGRVGVNTGQGSQQVQIRVRAANISVLGEKMQGKRNVVRFKSEVKRARGVCDKEGGGRGGSGVRHFSNSLQF